MSFKYLEDGRRERRRVTMMEPGSNQPLLAPRDYLHQLPALILLNRLPTPAVALGLDGEVVYANVAFTAMLGYPESVALISLSLPRLMVGHEATPGPDCVAALRAAAGTVSDFWHVDGYHLHAVVSDALLARVTDPVLLITLTDVTDVLWANSA
ncbi:MAG: PAS domain-containing protein [Mycolicibacterium sp.]|nr:PAS domain-containing protein [Mycolicibacterium sp.]